MRQFAQMMLFGGSLLLVAPPALAQSVVEARALALEQRLLAPCCWQGTLDSHHSELADSLHREIRERLSRGEAGGRIEQDLVNRYGQRMAAIGHPGVFESTALAVMLALCGVGCLVIAAARSWVRSSRQREGQRAESPASASETDYDAQLNAELRRLDSR